MKKLFILLLVLAILGFVGYKRGWIGKQAPETTPTVTPTIKPLVKPPDGIALYEKGAYAQAIKQLEKEIVSGRVKDIPMHLTYIARAHEELKNQDKANEAWRKIISEHTESHYCGDAYYALGRTAQDPQKKIEYFEKAVTKHPDSAGAKAASCELGETYLASNLPNKEFKARKCLTLALKSELPEEKKKEIKAKLIQLNQKLIFSKMPTPDSEIYVVKSGDTIASISQKYNIEAGGDIAKGQIRRINKLKTDWIYPDNKLKILTGKFRVEINKTKFLLTLYLNDAWIKEYQVAIGKIDDETPTGLFQVGGKVAHPPWTVRYDDGRSEIIPYGDPRNILGTRWMGFKESPRLGIHGTTQPESIGQKITDGCVRMLNNEVEELYDIIPMGTEIFVFE